MPERPGLLPPALGLLMMLGIFAAHFIKPLALLFPYPLNYLGLLPIAIGALINILAERELLLKHDNDRQQLNHPRVLVTSGLYRFSRNPSYIGLVLINAGLAIWVGSLSPWFVVLAFPFILSARYISVEEQQLHAQFGVRYEQYCQMVPRWLNWPKST